MLTVHVIHILDQLIVLFPAGGLDHADQFGFQLADLTGNGEQDSALVLAAAGVVGISGGIAVVIVGGSGTGIGGGVRPGTASGSGFAAGVPAVATSGVVLVVAVFIAGFALPVIIRMQVIIHHASVRAFRQNVHGSSRRTVIDSWV